MKRYNCCDQIKLSLQVTEDIDEEDSNESLRTVSSGGTGAMEIVETGTTTASEEATMPPEVELDSIEPPRHRR